MIIREWGVFHKHQQHINIKIINICKIGQFSSSVRVRHVSTRWPPLTYQNQLITCSQQPDIHPKQVPKSEESSSLSHNKHIYSLNVFRVWAPDSTTKHTDTRHLQLEAGSTKPNMKRKCPLTLRRCRSHRLRHPWPPPPCRSCLEKRNSTLDSSF